MGMPAPDPTYAAGTGWTDQSIAQVLQFDYALFTGSHSSPATITPTNLQLSNGVADTYSVSTKEVDLTGASVLPTGFSLNASTDVISLDGVTTVAGSYEIGLVATDTNFGLVAETSAVVTLT